MSTSPLLSLPGEIRNRIYEYCVEPKAIQLPRMPKRAEKPYEHVRFGLYGSLRNVCRQTRAEFGSMYMAKTVLVIHQVTAHKFFYSFYPGLRKQNGFGNEPLQPGRPTDELPVSTGVPGVQGNIRITTYYGLRYDTRLLVRLCAKYPSVKVAFTDASACLDLASSVDDFFAHISSGAFRPHLELVFQRIDITCSTVPEICFTFYSREIMEKAMKRVGEVDSRQALIEMGAPAMDAFAILFTDATSVYKHSAPQA